MYQVISRTDKLHTYLTRHNRYIVIMHYYDLKKNDKLLTLYK